ncbi:Mitochondrial inner membrane protease atp23 [Entophlyctis sp. JEL0112]|nr:Mitochondrial inner membrane protease atp23 [Entophlyctis sp. JEL0112]
MECALASEKPVQVLNIKSSNQNSDFNWDGFLTDKKTLFIHVPNSSSFGPFSGQSASFGFRECVVAVLELAEDVLGVGNLVVCLDKDRDDLAVLVRAFLFVGFELVHPSVYNVTNKINIDVMFLILGFPVSLVTQTWEEDNKDHFRLSIAVLTNAFELQMSAAKRWLDDALASNERITTLLKALADSGCAFKPANISVEPCRDALTSAGGVFHPAVGVREQQPGPWCLSCSLTNSTSSALFPATSTAQIRLCEENMLFKEQLEDTLTHELVHAYDWCTANWDLTNCRHQACSEVRAGLLSAECRMALELARGRVPVQLGMKRIEACVKRRAVLSLTANPWCSDLAAAKAAVDAVFPACAADRAPFE